MTEQVPVSAGLFSLNDDGSGHLLGGFCSQCASFHFPRAANCPFCAAEDCAERALGDRGRLYLFTVVQNRPPGYRGEVPFGFGVVELPEGLRIITRLTETRHDRLRFDMPMHLVFTPLHIDDDGRQVTTYAFAPDEESAT